MSDDCELSAVHTIDLLEEALSVAERLGIQVRREWLKGSAGGACRIGQRSVLFVDLSLTCAEQLDQVIQPLRLLELPKSLEISPMLRQVLTK